ncbi:hypothetical protein PFISCL1PPCAC_16308, partial [Pristionchus fissidentatus]
MQLIDIEITSYLDNKNNIGEQHSRTRSLLLSLEEGDEGGVGDLDDLETDTGNISDGVSGTTESGDEDLVVLLNEVQATVVGDEGGDLLSVLDKLDTNALADGRVRLLSLDSDLLEDDSLGVGSSSEGVGLPPGSEVSLLVVLVVPSLVTTVVAQLARRTDSHRLSHVCGKLE